MPAAHPSPCRRRPPAQRARAAGLAVVLLLVALLGACGGGEEEKEPAPDGEAPPSSSSTTTTVDEGPPAPLTGLPAPGVDLSRPALVVKVDNVDGRARPQEGLAAADLVYEEKIEGPISRFAAVYHSTDAPRVGPIRSGRSTDVEIVAPLATPRYAFTGANEVFLAQLRAGPLVDIGYDRFPDAYDRDPDRRAPENFFTSTERLWGLPVDVAEAAPEPQFRYRDPDEGLVDGQPVDGVRYSFGARGAEVRYRWEAELDGWRREQEGTPQDDADGTPVAPQNVIVQFVGYVDTGLVDQSGTPVPEAVLLGEGDAWVLSGGQAVAARWERAEAGEPTSYQTADGTPVKLAPGRTWIALVPVGGDADIVATDGELLGTPPG